LDKKTAQMKIQSSNAGINNSIQVSPTLLQVIVLVNWVEPLFGVCNYGVFSQEIEVGIV
jgi:hypothetical protein